MKWVDYRKKLGIEINDAQKFELLSMALQNYVYNVIGDGYDREAYLAYCIMIGEVCNSRSNYNWDVKRSFEKCRTTNELFAYFIAFYNTYKTSYYSNTKVSKKKVLEFFTDQLDSINIGYEIMEDSDGIFVFPKGAKELDDALVSEPLEWLKDYPNARKTYVDALKQYSDGIYIRDVADNLRKALEAFLQEFLNNTKNLETNKNIICRYLGEQGVDAGISGLFQPLINAYKSINDRIAKHNDSVDEKLLEFLLYQTGLLIRMVISVKKAEDSK